MSLVGPEIGPDRSYCFARETLGPFRTYLSEVTEDVPMPAHQPDPCQQRNTQPQRHYIDRAGIGRVIAGIQTAPHKACHMDQRVPPQDLAPGQGNRLIGKEHARDQEHRAHCDGPDPLPERHQPDQKAVHHAHTKAQRSKQPGSLRQHRQIRGGACFAEKQDAPQKQAGHGKLGQHRKDKPSKVGQFISLEKTESYSLDFEFKGILKIIYYQDSFLILRLLDNLLSVIKMDIDILSDVVFNTNTITSNGLIPILNKDIVQTHIFHSNTGQNFRSWYKIDEILQSIDMSTA